MFRALIKKEIEKIVLEIFSAKGGPASGWAVSASERPELGDYSSNVALVLAKKRGKNPMEIAEELKSRFVKTPTSDKFRVEIAPPGFLNFFISKDVLVREFDKNVLNKISRWGRAKPDFKSFPMRFGVKEILGKTFLSKPQKINLEFVSANPTGPLTMANGRGGFYGDALANILEAVGHKVTREYYINDAGNQIKLLGESILAAAGKIPDKEEYYKGEYIKRLKGKTAKQAAALLLKEIKSSLKNAGIRFDVWFSEEKDLRKKGALKKVLEFLNKKKILEERDGALWLGDAVVVKSNQEFTYFLSDLAYHYDKFKKRKYDLAIDVWGADHHGYIERMKKGVEALGVDPSSLQILILQLVRLMSKGKEVKMSKRAGEFVTLDDLLKDVGVDAARWFFLEKSLNTHMDFDMDLAKERSKKNPVYYVQYAHARACSILRNGNSGGGVNLQLLTEPEELALIKKILQLPEVVEDIASDYKVHRLTKYAYELAQVFTKFYETHKVIDDKNKDLTSARLALVSATLNAIRYTLSLMGISAPEKM